MAEKNKMIIVFVGHSFKYEIEATAKLFIPAERFNFSEDLRLISENDEYIIATLNEKENSTFLEIEVLYQSIHVRKELVVNGKFEDNKDICEHEICRLLFRCLQEITGIIPPWGLMTGIRPVKKVIELLANNIKAEEARGVLEDKYEISPQKLDLAFAVAENQIPILNKINKKAVSLYISIPFCPTRCSYCSFVSHSMESAIKLVPDYIIYLCKELEIIGKIVRNSDVEVDTIYFGGGTPTSIPANEIRKIMQTIADNFDVKNVREYNYEAGRADTITLEKLQTIKEYGVTRISVNPQSLNDSVLKAIGRKHSAEDTINAYKMARKVGFDNINMDIIAGLPTESTESFKNTLDKVIDLDPENITVHTLTLKRSATLFEEGKRYAKNHVEDMVDYSIEKLMKNGYNPYYLYRQKNTLDNLENVGYAKKGYENFYNIYIMDETQTILGAGCSASTKLVYPDGKISRIHNYKFPYEYINRFEALMKKKEEIPLCLKKINNL